MAHIDRKGLMEKLGELNIDAVTVEHPQVFTVEEMMPYVGHLPGIHAKNLFIRDKKKRRLWMVSARHDAAVDLADLAKVLGAQGGLRHADEPVLQSVLGVGRGCVTPLALINDVAGAVQFVADSTLLDTRHERIYFHPLVNTCTTGISPGDFARFLDAVGHKPVVVDFPDVSSIGDSAVTAALTAGDS